MTKLIGKHLTVDMYGCSFEQLESVEFIKDAILTALSEAHLTLLNFISHKFEPQGLTALTLLAEGHISVHSYPNMGYAAIDVFICGDQNTPEHVVRTLSRLFRPEKTKTTHIRRGDFGSISDMKPKVKVKITPLRRVRDTSAKVIRFLSRSK